MSQIGNYPGLTKQDELNWLTANDELRENSFLKKSENNWDTHRPMLLLGLHLTDPSSGVIEMGCGYGSTPFLRSYCKGVRILLSFDNSEDWACKMNERYVPDWDKSDIWQQPCGLLFVDHAPGEHRWKAIAAMVDKADIIVYHDNEIGGAGNYQYSRIEHLFKYSLHYNRNGGGAGCTMVSNKIDVSAYRGLSLGQFKFDE